jgi:hypothetical protein
MPVIEWLPVELQQQIFRSLDSAEDVIALSATCRRLHDVYTSSQQLRTLNTVFERQYGPLEDAIQLVTYNKSQPAHVIRNPSLSLSLFKQLKIVGRVAESWAEIYPLKKWKDNYDSRRLLNSTERFRVRRAIYRLWMYTDAFHTVAYPRDGRLLPQGMQRRAQLLRNWSSTELAEMADVHSVFRHVVADDICPSNGAVHRRFRRQHGDDSARHLVYNLGTPSPIIHLNYGASAFEPEDCGQWNSHCAAPPPDDLVYESPTYKAHTRTRSAYLARSDKLWDAGGEGWGDNLGHYYVVEDMLKLDPRKILWLKEQDLCKAQVLGYVRSLGDWFDNYGDTWAETLNMVLHERDEDEDEFYGEGIVAEEDL